MTHYIKILPEYFNAVATGRKSFEVRCNDRKYTVGDRLIMQEVDEHGRLSGQSIVCKITYIFSDTEYVKEGYVVLSVVFIRKTRLLRWRFGRRPARSTMPFTVPMVRIFVRACAGIRRIRRRNTAMAACCGS